MKYDINSYSLFLEGELNPLSNTSYDKSALKAEKRFQEQIENYIDPHIVKVIVKNKKIEENSDYLTELVDNLDMIDLGFEINDKIKVVIEPLNEHEIEIVLKTKAKGEIPDLKSKKIKFYEKKRKEIQNGIKDNLMKTTLNIKTEDGLRVYINQQYQFGSSLIKKLYQRRSLIGELEGTIGFSSKVKRPHVTNETILTFIISDLWSIIKHIEERYENYLNSNPVNIREFEKNLYSSKKNRVNTKSTWRDWFKLEFLEVKPNIAGLGININKIIESFRK